MKSKLIGMLMLATFGAGQWAGGEVLLLEDFGGTTGPAPNGSDLDGQDYTALGMTGPWTNPTPFGVTTGNNVIAGMGLGGGASGHAHNNDAFNNATKFDSRAMSVRLDLGVDKVYYMSFYTFRRNTAQAPVGFATGTETTDEFIAVGLNSANLAIGHGLLGDTNGLYQVDAQAASGATNNASTYVVVRITASSAGTDTIEAGAYDGGNIGIFDAGGPLEGEVLWRTSHSFTSDAQLDTFVMGYKATSAQKRLKVDGVRLGESWFDVTGISTSLALGIRPGPGLDEVTLFWPTTTSPSAGLESSSDLGSGNPWTPVGGIPVEVSGDFELTLTRGTSEEFYRLAIP